MHKLDVVGEKRLIFRIIEQAIIDAQTGSSDAFDFLTTQRVIPFLQMLEIDSEVFFHRIVKILEDKSYA